MNLSKSILEILFILFLIIIFVFTGSSNTLLVKIQNQIQIRGELTQPPENFKHPFIQSVCVFFGMSLFFPFIFFHRPKRLKVNELYFFLPVLSNFCGNALCFYALQYTYASIYQMLTSLISIYTLFLWTIIFRKLPKLTEIVGVIMTWVGALLVGFSSSLEPNTSNKDINPKTIWIGNVLCVLGMSGFAFQYIFEEILYRSHSSSSSSLSPFFVIGIEGVLGVPLSFLLSSIFSFLSPKEDEDFTAFFLSFLVNPLTEVLILLLFLFLMIVCLGVYNVVGSFITKKLSSPSRSILDMIRMITVWIVQIFRGKDRFSVLRLFGFGIILIGSLCFAIDLSKIITSLLRKNKKNTKNQQQYEEEDYQKIIDEVAINENSEEKDEEF